MRHVRQFKISRQQPADSSYLAAAFFADFAVFFGLVEMAEVGTGGTSAGGLAANAAATAGSSNSYRVRISFLEGRPSLRTNKRGETKSADPDRAHNQSVRTVVFQESSEFD